MLAIEFQRSKRVFVLQAFQGLSSTKAINECSNLNRTMTINELAPRIFITAALLAVFLFFTVSEG
jgi:hypothetical protein